MINLFDIESLFDKNIEIEMENFRKDIREQITGTLITSPKALRIGINPEVDVTITTCDLPVEILGTVEYKDSSLVQETIKVMDIFSDVMKKQKLLPAKFEATVYDPSFEDFFNADTQDLPQNE